jgi:hypothetical protein
LRLLASNQQATESQQQQAAAKRGKAEVVVFEQNRELVPAAPHPKQAASEL